MRLKTHHVTLVGKGVTLRPLTEDDWPTLFVWNNDKEILHYTDADDVNGYDLAEVKDIYRSVSQSAYCFIAEVEHTPIGECWLQEMNVERILCQHPGKTCRRIDLMIGEKNAWGRGLGTEMICLLTGFAVGMERTDLIFGCNIADYNVASIRAFQKAGYAVISMIDRPLGGKPRHWVDLMLEVSHVLRR